LVKKNLFNLLPIKKHIRANWFFHIFMDTNASAPHYGRAPRRISSTLTAHLNVHLHAQLTVQLNAPRRISDSSAGMQRTGFSEYGQWTFGDPALRDPQVWTRGLPTPHDAAAGRGCGNPGGKKVCANVTQATFPPKVEASLCPFGRGG
jgi:hypothetical protein